MKQVLILVGAMLVLSSSATAQGPAGVDSSGGSHSTSHSAFAADLSQWQLALGYQYNHINLTGTAYNTNGMNTSVARFFGSWFGVEGQLGMGFGNTGTTTVPPNLTSKPLFAGVGPRLAFRGHGRIEPWVHGVGGMLHFRFTQTAGVLGSNTALAGEAGGGIDFHLNPRVAIRTEVDFIESRFFSRYQRHFQAVTGFVFNF
jgi:hypothetical protein